MKGIHPVICPSDLWCYFTQKESKAKKKKLQIVHTPTLLSI